LVQFFFFQAEDGIRDFHVTGVQTCALPILMGVADALAISQATLRNMKQNLLGAFVYNSLGIPIAAGILWPLTGTLLNPVVAGARSEERRVGKEGRAGWWPCAR